jgi:hypothetical protein
MLVLLPVYTPYTYFCCEYLDLKNMLTPVKNNCLLAVNAGSKVIESHNTSEYFCTLRTRRSNTPR